MVYARKMRRHIYVHGVMHVYMPMHLYIYGTHADIWIVTQRNSICCKPSGLRPYPAWRPRDSGCGLTSVDICRLSLYRHYCQLASCRTFAGCHVWQEQEKSKKGLQEERGCYFSLFLTASKLNLINICLFALRRLPTYSLVFSLAPVDSSDFAIG